MAPRVLFWALDMSIKFASVFSRSRFTDSDSWSEALYHGGALPGDDFDLSHVTGYYGAMLRAVYEEPPDHMSSYDYEQVYQEQRPDIFIRKLPDRRRFVRAPTAEMTPSPASTFVTAEQFAEHYEAAAFAFNWELHCETAVTLWWSALGAHGAPEAQKLFSAFTKDLNDWLFRRCIPTAYFFSHENSSRIGLHTHLAVHLSLPKIGRRSVRDDFRRWAMGWPERNGLGLRKRAIRVTGPAKDTPWLHWYRFHYQVKGHDPGAVVRQAGNSEHGRAVMLSDLIAYRWQDPGVVAMRPRIGHALNLGPARRTIGIPAGFDEPRNATRRRTSTQKSQLFGAFLTQSQLVPPPSQPPVRSPYVSRYRDGWRDVGWLYPDEFSMRVTKLSRLPAAARPAPAPLPDDFMSEPEIS